MRLLLIGLIGLVAAGCQTTETRIGAGPVPKNATMERCISNYMKQNGFALALAVDGSSCGWVYCPDVACRTGASMQRAILECEKGTTASCAVYAFRKEVVWREDLPAKTGTSDSTTQAKVSKYDDVTDFAKLPIRVTYNNRMLEVRKEALESYAMLLANSPEYRGVFAVGSKQTWGYGVAKTDNGKESARLLAAKRALNKCEEVSAYHCQIFLDHQTVVASGEKLQDLLKQAE